MASLRFPDGVDPAPSSPSTLLKNVRELCARGLDVLIELIARLTKEPTLASPFLQGIFAPQPNEITVPDAEVEGKLPEDLDGYVELELLDYAQLTRACVVHLQNGCHGRT